MHLFHVVAFVPLVSALAALWEPSPVLAIEYPWCAVYTGNMGAATNCGFVTLEQCRANVSGIGGWCERNALYRSSPETRSRIKRKLRS